MPRLEIDKELQRKINYGEVSLIDLLLKNGFVLTKSMKQSGNQDKGFVLEQ